MDADSTPDDDKETQRFVSESKQMRAFVKSLKFKFATALVLRLLRYSVLQILEERDLSGVHEDVPYIIGMSQVRFGLKTLDHFFNLLLRQLRSTFPLLLH